MCSVRNGVLRNFEKFTGKHLLQSFFFNKVSGCVNCSWSFLCLLLLKISRLFHFDRKMKGKKRNTLMRLKYLLFCFSNDLFDIKISKEIWQMVICSEKEFKRNLILQFSWLEDFAEKMFLCGEHFTSSKTKNGLYGQL